MAVVLRTSESARDVFFKSLPDEHQLQLIDIATRTYAISSVFNSIGSALDPLIDEWMIRKGILKSAAATIYLPSNEN